MKYLLDHRQVKSFTRNSLNEYEICRVLTRTTLVLFPVASSMLLLLQVAEYLVPNIRSIPTNGSTKATYIRFLTGLKAYSQIFSVKWSTFAPLISFASFLWVSDTVTPDFYIMISWFCIDIQRIAFGARRNRYVLEDWCSGSKWMDRVYIYFTFCWSQLVYIKGNLAIFLLIDLDR